MSDGSDHRLTTDERTVGSGETTQWDDKEDWEQYQSKNGVSVGSAGVSHTALSDAVWESASDWDKTQSQTGIVHKSISGTDFDNAGLVQQGLPVGPTANITEGLVGWWPLHTTSGNAPDLSGNGNDGAHNGTTRGVVGKGGLQATSFDGTEDYIDLGDALAQFSKLSFGCWAFHDDPATTSREYLIWLGANNDAAIRETQNADEVEAYIYNGSSVKGVTASVSSSWHHHFLTWDGSTLEYYQDGTSQGTVSVSQMNNKGASDKMGKML